MLMTIAIQRSYLKNEDSKFIKPQKKAIGANYIQMCFALNVPTALANAQHYFMN